MTHVSSRLRWLSASAQNALEMMRLGRLAEPDHAPFRVVHRTSVYALRRYGEDGRAPEVRAPLLLVPPLMVASEIYDMAADISAVAALLRAGMDVWLVDFGAPERIEGGMERTLDDHVKAVSDAVDRARAATGRDVHLAGYSQGGMFAYQAAAYRSGEGLASIVTFGSPVDIHRNLPKVSDGVAGPLIAAARAMLDLPIQKTKGLPGVLTSTGFKLLSARKEVAQVADFVRKLHDRQALERRESRRRFLGGEGFVAWPGPALRTFIDEFVVHNRMTRGGFVIDGRSVSLADVRVPVLYFVGLRDSIAQPAAVRAVRRAMPEVELHEVDVKAGHFGLVVGSHALATTWPTVASWVRWREGEGPKPSLLSPPPAEVVEEPEDAAFEDVELDLGLLFDAMVQAADNAWTRLGEVSEAAGQALTSMRYQLPRLAALQGLGPDARVSLGRALSEKAAATPDATFFLWEGRAFSYADAERRVDAVARGLLHCGVQRGERVGVLMQARPSMLTAITALGRVGAVAVLLDPAEERVGIGAGVLAGDVARLVVDPEHAARARAAYSGAILCLGGGAPGARAPTPEGVIDMEAIDPAAVALPAWYEPNPGRARDLAMVLFTAPRGDGPRAAHITNRRWAVSAFGAAASCTLTPEDTVYCCLPLHHPSGLLVTVGGALVGGARLALATGFDEARFWPEVRRYGATVVFYAGEMLRPLVEAPPSASDNVTPVRLFAGSGMPSDLWEELVSRFSPAGVLEFYASTEGEAVLANASGEKVGAVGRPLPGSAELALLAYDVERGALSRDGAGFGRKVGAGDPGLLAARVDDAERSARAPRSIQRDVLVPGDAWYLTGDLMRRDEEGDYFLLGAARDTVLGPDGAVFPRLVEDDFMRLASVRSAAAYAVQGEGAPRRLAVAVELAPSASVEALVREVEGLPRARRPAVLRVVAALPRTTGFGRWKAPLAAAGERHSAGERVFRLGPSGAYAVTEAAPVEVAAARRDLEREPR
jgi:putative long chain acyl-CoA synthase